MHREEIFLDLFSQKLKKIPKNYLYFNAIYFDNSCSKKLHPKPRLKIKT